MSNTWFQFKEFKINQNRVAFKFGADAALLGAWCPILEDQSILEVGAGTGVISLMCAQRNPSASITGIELDYESYEQCAENFEASKWSSQLNALHGDFNLYPFNTRFDHIVCNPPFFAGSTQNQEERLNQARHEIKLSLSNLLKRSSELLSLNGSLSLVLPHERLGEVEGLADELGFGSIKQLSIRPSLNKKANRVLVVFSRRKARLHFEELVLYSSPSVYSGRSTELLKPFYLKL